MSHFDTLSNGTLALEVAKKQGWEFTWNGAVGGLIVSHAGDMKGIWLDKKLSATFPPIETVDNALALFGANDPKPTITPCTMPGDVSGWNVTLDVGFSSYQRNVEDGKLPRAIVLVWLEWKSDQ